MALLRWGKERIVLHLQWLVNYDNKECCQLISLCVGCQWVPSTPPTMKAIPSAVNGAALIWFLLLPCLSLAIKLPNLIQLMQQLSKVSS